MRLMSGVFAAQVLQFLSIPLLAIYYTPAEFGTFGIFTSIVSIVVCIVFFRYEQVIVTAKKNTELNAVLLLSIFIALIMIPITSISISIISYFFFPELYSHTMIFLFFSYLALEGFNKFFLYYFNRIKKYKLLSLTKVIQTICTALISLAFINTDLKPIGLIIGFVGGSLCSFITYIIYNLKTKTLNIKKSSWLEIKKVMYKYKNFALFTMPNDFVNTISRQIPILILPSYFSISEVGIYSMAVRLVNAPISLFGYAYGQVFFQKLSRLFELKPRKISSFFHRNVKYLAKMSVALILLVWFVAPIVIELFFNNSWTDLPFVMKLQLPSSVIMFVTSPLSFIVLVLNKQKSFFIYELILLSLRAGVLLTSIALGFNFYMSILNYSLTVLVMNVILLKLLYRFSKTPTS